MAICTAGVRVKERERTKSGEALVGANGLRKLAQAPPHSRGPLLRLRLRQLDGFLMLITRT